jgi:hypothetical protein
LAWLLGELHLDGRLVVLEQPLQLQHRLARQDHLLALPGTSHIERGLRQRQAVAVGGHQRERACPRR